MFEATQRAGQVLFEMNFYVRRECEIVGLTEASLPERDSKHGSNRMDIQGAHQPTMMTDSVLRKAVSENARKSHS